MVVVLLQANKALELPNTEHNEQQNPQTERKKHETTKQKTNNYIKTLNVLRWLQVIACSLEQFFIRSFHNLSKRSRFRLKHPPDTPHGGQNDTLNCLSLLS
ncbi:hypothetical protein Hanom_Chr05g00451011 [Helianthus anomalus]